MGGVCEVLGGSVWCVRRAKEGPYHRIRLSLAGVVVTSRRLALKSAQDGLNHLRLAAGGGVGGHCRSREDALSMFESIYSQYIVYI